ncbi:MAG: proteasome beta subunit [Thermoplasmata archaeon]|jgi:proteasome beta subunit|nr:proteasome beta subunit [Thermoplasmata archaeon]
MARSDFTFGSDLSHGLAPAHEARLPLPTLPAQGPSGAPAAKTGTTTLAIAGPDGVVMATERRATMGHLIGHKHTQKLFPVDRHLALTTAGLVGDAQMIARHLQAQAQLYRFKRDAPMPVRGASTLLGNILNASRFAPYWVQLIVGGYDDKGGSIYSVDAAGGAIQENWTVTGSGSPYAFGVLEDRIGNDLSVKEGVDLAIRALNASMRRDSASGNGMDIAIIDGNGFRRLTDEEVLKRHKALKLPASWND